MQPADLQLYHKSAEKRGRLSTGQTPDTPAKAETKLDITKASDLKKGAEADGAESPLLELSEDEDLLADTDASVEITPAIRIKVCFGRQQLSGVAC